MKIKPILIILLALAALAFGQEKEKDGNSQPKLRNNRTYQLQFTFTELEDGKKINTRTYMVRAIGIERFSIREGSRVPITTKENQTTYIDVGLNISGRMNERENGFADLGFGGSVEMSGLVNENEQSRIAPNGPPAMRNLSYTLGSAITEGKSVRLLDVDQPDGKRRLQIDLVVTAPN